MKDCSSTASRPVQPAGQILLSLSLTPQLRNQPEETKTIVQSELLHKTDHRARPSNACMDTLQSSGATGNTGLETIALKEQIKLVKIKGGEWMAAIKVVMSQGDNYV